MADDSQRPKGRNGVLSSLNAAIDGPNLAKEVSSIAPAKAIFGSVTILLTMIRVSFLLFYDRALQAHTRPGLVKWITSSSGYPALIFAEPLNEEWMERD